MINGTIQYIIGMPRHWKRVVQVGSDVVALCVVLWGSYSLRYNTLFVPDADQALLMAAAPCVALPIFIRMGLYRSVIRYLPERAVWTIFQAMTLATLAWVFVAFLTSLAVGETVPRSVPIIYWALATIVMVSTRFAAKMILWPREKATSVGGQLVIYGAGNAGQQLAAALRGSGKGLVVGFIDDNPGLHGREVAGIRVYHPEYLQTLVRNYGVGEVILCMPSVSAQRRQELLASLTPLSLRIRILPAIADIAAGKYLISQVREIDIDELLGRSIVPADGNLLRTMIEGRSIMVTGAGGSIGSELCRLVARWKPARLVLLEANEFALYQIDRELRSAELAPVAVLASVRDGETVDATIKQYGIDAIFHAAAHKHVPLVEENALEGIRNNVFGTQVLLDRAFHNGVKNFILISSDKAVRPTNVMGATKRWSELLVHSYAARAQAEQTGQKFAAVRFGNVLGSSGSVVPLFREQIAKGGPVTLTDEGMTRYFMSIHEAAELIVQAGTLSQGNDVFLLDMGSPIAIMDLATNMIRLAGLSVRDAHNPAGDIRIDVMGKRPGEKMFEELFYDPHTVETTSHPKIMRASPAAAMDISPQVVLLRRALEARDEIAARSILFDVIAEGRNPLNDAPMDVQTNRTASQTAT
ncbi:nucleoside-diphosphate sugar epimerase/dehydratase [uncultured Devosia sp.]|uniref:polysaccharide biosynthesis protein n=1 Tax=uncultured Devosia sp. TaxID=211434 RepID=UPI002632E735|nr:nucleoside-diphosphate sugar epimerase/dehydratase [uncultured Devosia sp.]